MRPALLLPLAVACVLLALSVDESQAAGRMKSRGSRRGACPAGTRRTYTTKRWCHCKPPKPERYGSLIFVVDATKGMKSELDIVKRRIGRIIDANKRFKDYVVALFGDPYVRRVRRSSKKSAILRFIKPAVARGGGDCPNFALSGVEDAIRASRRRSILFLFTDASAKDRRRKEAKVIRRLKRKSIEVVVVATGRLCGRAYKNEYHRLAAKSGGQVIRLSKRDVEGIMTFVEKGAKGQVSFRSFPKTAKQLQSGLKGKCGCRNVRIKVCKRMAKSRRKSRSRTRRRRKSKIRCPRNRRKKGACHDGKRTDTIYTYKISKGVCVKHTSTVVRRRGCGHTRCRRPSYRSSKCVRGWRTRTRITYTYKRGLRRCVRRVGKARRVRCRKPCPSFERVLRRSPCSRHRGKYFRIVTYLTNVRTKAHRCKKVRRKKRVACTLTPCPKSKVLRGVCRSKKARGHKKGHGHGRTAAVYTHDTHVYYVRNSKAKCIRRQRVQRRLCTSKMCRCFAIGDPHYKTFDRLRINFYGGCKYVLSETVSTRGECAFRITGKNWYRGRKRRHGVVGTKYIEITVGGHTYTLGQQRLLFVDGNPTLMPHRAHSGIGYVFYTGRAIEFASEKCGINVYWDGKSAASVRLNQAKYGGRVRGLCGNCDGDARNDLTDASGKVYKGRSFKNIKKVALSYLVKDKSSSKEKQLCTKSEAPPDISTESEKKFSNKEWCGSVSKTRGPFGKCLSSGKVSHEFYFRSCIIDLSLLETRKTELKETFCDIMKAVNEDCAEAGFEGIDWRKDTDCAPKCPANSRFSAKMNPCPATCESALFETKRRCFSLPHREGCECKNGYVLDGQRCVRKGECSCLSCIDAAPSEQCAKWKKQGHCRSLFETSGMLMACRKTCGFCHQKPICEDYIASSVCARAKATGSCSKSFYKHFCGLTCNWRSCPCRNSKTVKGKCEPDGTRTVTIYRYNRDGRKNCILDRVERRESCRRCIGSVKRKWGRCNYCTGKRVGNKIETYRSGIRCLKRKTRVNMSCGLCKFPNGKSRHVTDRFCKGGNTLINRFTIKRRTGCYECKTEKSFSSTTVACRRRPRVSTTPVRGTKTELLKICKYRLGKCRCLESCKTITQPTECKPRKVVRKRCVIRRRKAVWKVTWQNERLVRKKLTTRCERFKKNQFSDVVCPKRLKSITIRGKKCKLSERVTYYYVNSKCLCKKAIKYKSKGYFCCPKPKNKKGACKVIRGVNVMRPVRTIFYKLVKGMCIKQSSGTRLQVCMCRPRRYQRECQFGQLNQWLMKCRVQRGARGNYCKCTQEKIVTPVTCRFTSTRRLTGCTIRKGINRYMKVRYFYSVKRKCKCVKRHRDRLVWCGCQGKPMYEVKPCPRRCKNPRKCSNKCVKQHIRYIGVMQMRNKQKVCVRKIVSLQKERCCCSPVVLNLRPKKKCMPGGMLFRFTYVKKLCRGKKSKLAQCCLVRQANSRRVACKQGVLKTEASRCGSNGYFTISKTIAKLKKCKCTRTVLRSLCRCKCPKKSKRVACEPGKRIWRVTTVTHKIVNCKCKRAVVVREFPLDPCKRIPRSPSKVGKCNKHGIKKLYYVYSVRSGCKCKKKTKTVACRCRCSRRVSNTRWRCSEKSGVLQRTKHYTVKLGCHCVPKKKVETKPTRCHRRRKVEKVCRRGVLLFFQREFQRHGCRCKWTTTNVVGKRCDPPRPPKVIERKRCVSGNIQVTDHTRIVWKKRSLRLFDHYYTHYEKVVSKKTRSRPVYCKKRRFAPEVGSCRHGKYLKITRYQYISNCQCKVGSKRKFKSCLCRKSLKRESSRCDSRNYATVSTWRYRRWSSAQEGCIWVKKVVSEPVHCSFRNTVIRGRCSSGKTYKITTEVQLPDRKRCKCRRVRESRTVSCRCKPITRRKRCDKKRSCLRYTYIRKTKWDHKKSRCVPFGKTLTKRIVCCCSTKVKSRTRCAADGHKRSIRSWQVYASKPVPRCVQKEQTEKLTVNCQASMYQRRLLKKKTTRSKCGRDGYMVLKYYRLRLNKKRCRCERYVHRSKRCRCSCRRSEKFERSFCEKTSNRQIRVYSRMLLKNCGCVKTLIQRPSGIRCRRKPISSTWSKCNKKTCNQHRIDSVERPQNCKCRKFSRRRLNIKRRCCCNKNTTSASVCTKMGWKVTTVHYNFDRRIRRCAKKTRQNVVQDDHLINCKNNPRFTRVKSENCALIIYHNRYWIDFHKCKCKRKWKPVKAGKWCCSKEPKTKRFCAKGRFVYEKIVQKLKGIKCVNTYTYRKKAVPCKKQSSIMGKCNDATGWATDYIGKAFVMLNCACKRIRVPRKRRCACPKPSYVTDCLKNAGIVRRIRISYILSEGQCIRKRKVVSQTRVCTRKPVLHHSSSCSRSNYITDMYKAQRRVGCHCFTRFFTKQRLCRCDPLRSKKVICKGHYLRILHYMHFVNKKYTACTKKIILRKKRFVKCRNETRKGKCKASGMKGRMVQKIERVLRHVRKCKCITRRVIESTKVCKCPDPFSKRGNCNRETEKRKITHFTFTLNAKRTKCRRHQRTSHEVCYCKRRARKTTKCDRRSGNKLIVSTWRQFDSKKKSCERKKKTDIKEVVCEERTTRTKTDCTASGVRTDIIKRYYKDFNTCSCRESPRPVKIRCACVPKCHKKVVRCIGGQQVAKQQCFRLKAVSPFVNKCAPYYLKKTNDIQCTRAVKYQKHASCKKCVKTFYKWIYRNIGCKCKRLKKFWKRVRCCCPKGHCGNTCELKGTAKFRICTSFKLLNGSCVKHVKIQKIPIECLKKQEFWTKCRKQRAGGRWFRCTVLKNVIRSTVRNCKCHRVSAKVYRRYCCCGPRTIKDRCNKKTGILTRTVTKKLLIGEGFCKPVPRVKVIPAPMCRGSFKGENIGGCDMKRNEQKFLMWTIYRHGCKCKKRKRVHRTSCGCRHKKPLGPFWTKCVKGVRKVYFHYFTRVKISRWRYKCVKKRVNHNIIDHCGSCGKPERSRRVCKGSYWLKVTRTWKRKSRTIKIPGRYYGSIKVTYRVCMRTKKTKASSSISCADPPEYKAKCNNFRKSIYRYYYEVRKCTCKLRRSLVTVRACMCHKKNYSRVRCHPRTNQLVTSNYLYTARNRVCMKTRRDDYHKVRCSVGRVVRDKTVTDCKNGRRKGVSMFKKVRYFLYYYSNCKCRKRHIFKWKLCGCASMRKKEVCRNGRWYSTLYSVTPRYDRNACQVTKRFVNSDVSCSRNARIKRLSSCNASCIRKYAVYYRRLDRRTCSCRYAEPIILKQVCGCNKCPKVGENKITKKVTCAISDGIKIFTTIKKVFVHNGNLFNRWDITLPKYKCRREVKSSKHRIVCSKGSVVTKEQCNGPLRVLTVRRQVRVGCRCRMKFSNISGGRCQCKGKKPREPKIWKSDDCSKPPYMRRVTIFSYKLDKSNAKKWMCKITSKTTKERCGCPRNVKHSAYCNGKGSIIYKKTWKQFLARLRSCELKTVASKKAASCSEAQLLQNGQPPRTTACSAATGFMVSHVKKWYEVDPRDCKCKRKTKQWRCPCRCAHKNREVKKRCVSGHIVTYTAVNYVKKGCQCLRTTRGRKKYVTCRHKREDEPDRKVIGKCQRKGPSRNAGYVRVEYEKEYPRRCACKVSRRKRWEPCDCSLIPQYKSRTRLMCHKSGAFFNRITTYYVVQTSHTGAAFCERRRTELVLRINKCFDRRGRPLRRTVSSGFDTCSRKRTGCNYHLLIQQTHVAKCACKWRTIESVEKKCCCNRPTMSHSCMQNDTKVKKTIYYILDGSGQCVKKTKKQKYRLVKRKACKYRSGYIVRCHKGRKTSTYRKYLPSRFHFVKCKCVRTYRDIRVPCQCIPRKIIKKVRCDAENNRWVHEVVVRRLSGRAERTRCVAKSHFHYKKTCTRRQPHIVMGRCNKSKVRLRTIHYEIKKGCLCVRRKKLETISCKCRGKNWWISKEALCKPRRNGYSYYPKLLMGYRYVEKDNRCVVAKLKTRYVICGCPKPTKRKRCVRNEWRIREINYKISMSKNTCVRSTRRTAKPVTQCSTEKTREEFTSYVDMKTGYKTITYNVVVNRGCKCIKYKEKKTIEWICKIIMKPKIKETERCFKGVIYQKRAGQAYFNYQKKCTVDYSTTKIDVTSYCSRAGKVRRKVVGKCNSKTGRQKVEYSTWKPNRSKCTCKRTVKIKLEICDCEPIHSRYQKRGCRNHSVKYVDTYLWTLVNGVCVRGRQRDEKEVVCRVGRFKKESQCDPLTKMKEVTIIQRKLRNCSCRETIKSHKCMCKCRKDRTSRICDPRTGYTVIRKVQYDLKQCACKKLVSRVTLKPPPPCGKKTVKKEQCRRGLAVGSAVAGYQKVTVCKAKRRGCRCRLVCVSKKRLCYCSPDVRVKKLCIGHTMTRVTTFKYSANHQLNRCEWRELSKVTVNKDCYAMVDIPDTKRCNKKNGVLVIKHWRYQPINCKCRKRVYKITNGRCKCNSAWHKVSEGHCDTTQSCTKPVVFERQVLHGIRCIKKRRTDYVTCSCSCKLSVPPTRTCDQSRGTWVTSKVAWKLRCSHTTGSCKCERKVSNQRHKPKCDSKQVLPFCNKRTRRVEVRYREERLSRSRCRCYWTVVNIKRGFCHCRRPEVQKSCEAHKYRVKTTTITETLDDKHWRCIRSSTSTHEPVRPSCKPSQSVRYIKCNALKDRHEWKIVTLRMLHPESCKCIRVVHRYPQVCICKDLPKKSRYSAKCHRKSGTVYTTLRSRKLQRDNNGDSACNIVTKTTMQPISCGDGRWHYAGSPVCKMLAKNGCNSYRRYNRVVRRGCTCSGQSKRVPCKCCCPKGGRTRQCSADGLRYLYAKRIFEKRDCKCVRTTRRWSVAIGCSKLARQNKRCLKDGREKIVTTVSRPVNCSCKKFSQTTWCMCRCPKRIRETRCDAEQRQKVTSYVRFHLKGCKCELKQDVQRRTVSCKNGGRKRYRKIGKCNMTTRMQLYEYMALRFDDISCDCKRKKMRIYKACKCKGTEKKVVHPCNRACRKVLRQTRYRIIGRKCQRRSREFSQICCCRGKRSKSTSCDVKGGAMVTVHKWQKMEYSENLEPECNWKEKKHRSPVLGCQTDKVTYKDSRCVKGKYTRLHYKKVIRAKKEKGGTRCQCVKVLVRKEARYCKCPHSRDNPPQCRNNNVVVLTKTKYVLEDGQCHKYASKRERILFCAKSLQHKFKWSKCDRRTCKRKKYATLCSFKNCKINIRVDYRTPKSYDCCCPSSKVRVKFVECQNARKRRVYRLFWQVFNPKRMVCSTHSKSVYKPLRCGGWKARRVYPGPCRVRGPDRHYYQKVRIRYEEYEEGCTCRKKSVEPLRLCKCLSSHTVRVCKRTGVLEYRTMSYRLVVKKGKRSCKAFVSKHWSFRPPCVPASRAKWSKRVSKCADGIKVVTDYRRVRLGCKCKTQERVTSVICGCSKAVLEKKRCHRGRWEVTKYGKRLSCRSERFCSCVPYQTSLHKLPACPKGTVKTGKCLNGFQKIHARLYTIKNCQCTLREFNRHRRCPSQCLDLISTRTCRRLMRQGLCEHPQRQGTLREVCARTCGKCFKCKSPNTIKYHSFIGFSLKSSVLYSKRFYIKTIRRTKVSHCMLACKEDEGCNSFDYSSKEKTCVLNSVSKFSVKDRVSTFKEANHKVDENVVHFVKYCKHKCRCGTFTPMGKCVCEGSGVLRRCYKQFSMREAYNRPDGSCDLRSQTVRMKADCENPCVDQIEARVCREAKQSGKCLKDRETRVLCNKTCSRCACNKQYTVRVPCQRVKGKKGLGHFERQIMQVRYKRARCGICTTNFRIRRETCKPAACFEQTIKVIGDCIGGKRLVVTYAIELTDMAKCKRRKISDVQYGCKGVCNTISMQVSKCRYHKRDKKYYRNVMSSFWVSNGTKPKELAVTRKYLCDPSVCPKEVTFKGPCLLGHRFRYRIYYVLDYKERCTKFVSAHGESCSRETSKSCRNVLPRRKCAEVKSKGYCLRHNGPARLCMKTCDLCKPHRVTRDKTGKTKTKKLDKAKIKEAYGIIKGISSRYGGRYLRKVTWATMALSGTAEGKAFIRKSFKIPGKGKIQPPDNGAATKEKKPHHAVEKKSKTSKKSRSTKSHGKMVGETKTDEKETEASKGSGDKKPKAKEPKTTMKEEKKETGSSDTVEVTTETKTRKSTGGHKKEASEKPVTARKMHAEGAKKTHQASPKPKDDESVDETTAVTETAVVEKKSSDRNTATKEVRQKKRHRSADRAADKETTTSHRVHSTSVNTSSTSNSRAHVDGGAKDVTTSTARRLGHTKHHTKHAGKTHHETASGGSVEGGHHVRGGADDLGMSGFM